MEHYRTATSLTMLQKQPSSSVQGLWRRNCQIGHKSNQQRKGQRKAQGQQRKGQRQRIQQLERKKQRHGYVNNKGQSKGNIGQASPLKGKSGKGFKRKRKTSTGEGKGNTQTCYRCEGMQSNSVQHQREQHGRTTDGCNRPMRLTGRSRQLMSWWTSDQTLDMSMATTDAIYIYNGWPYHRRNKENNLQQDTLEL